MAKRLSDEAFGGALRPQATAVVLFMLLVMGVAVGLGTRLFGSITQLQDNVARANEDIEAASYVLDALQDAETGQRGFLLTMRPSYLEPYWNSGGLLEVNLDRLQKRAKESPWLEADVAALASVARQKMSELDGTIQLALKEGQQAALPIVLTDAGRAEMDAARARVAAITNHAIAERDQQTAHMIAHERFVLYGMIGAAGSGVALLGGTLLGLLASRAKLIDAQRALRGQSQRLQAAVDHLPDGIAVFDASNGLLLHNALFFPVSGLPPSLGAPGTSIEGFVAAAENWNLRLPSDSPVNALQITGEVQTRGKVLEIWRAPMPDGGQMLGISDITRRSNAEAVARQAHKMEALGQLTGGVAHDFNNLLQIVSANLELVGTQASGGDEAMRDRLASAQHAVEGASRLTRHLLAFARRQPLSPEAIDLARLLRGMEEILRRALGGEIEIELVLSGGLWAVRADPHQLENAVLNLAINGRDAVLAAANRAERRITIEATNAALDAGYAADNAEVAPGQYVLLAISDTGIGMTPEQIGRAVEPFYTTKPDGKGTGLGLSMVYGFAKQSGGHFKIYSEPGHGTTAKLYLPRTHIAPVRRVEAPVAVERGSGELILIVEDDADVRAAAVEALNRLGYSTIEADSAAAALALLRSERRPDLLFTDVVMPGQPSSRELAAQAAAIHPGIAVLFTSGYTANAVVHHGQVDPGVRLLSKPWRVEDLAREVHQALAARTRPPKSNLPLRVLLVEDDPLVRMITADLLAEMGHEVSAASNAVEALRSLDGGADVMVADIGLPDMDGRRLAVEARSRQPGLPIVIASGLGEQNTDGSMVWLPKPYGGASLKEALLKARTLLASAGARVGERAPAGKALR